MQSQEELRLIDAIQCCDRYQDALNQTCYNLKEHQEKTLENKRRKKRLYRTITRSRALERNWSALLGLAAFLGVFRLRLGGTQLGFSPSLSPVLMAQTSLQTLIRFSWPRILSRLSAQFSWPRILSRLSAQFSWPRILSRLSAQFSRTIYLKTIVTSRRVSSRVQRQNHFVNVNKRLQLSSLASLQAQFTLLYY